MLRFSSLPFKSYPLGRRHNFAIRRGSSNASTPPKPPQLTQSLEQKLKRLEAELENSLVVRTRQFSEWRRQNTARILLVGGISGVSIVGGAVLSYVYTHPALVEWGVVQFATRAFNQATTFDDRLAVYLGLPEPDVPIASLEAEILQMISTLWEKTLVADPNPSSNKNSVSLSWARHVTKSFSELDSSLLLSTKSMLREKLLIEIMESVAPLEKLLIQIREVFPPSVERNVFVNDLIDGYVSPPQARSLSQPSVGADGNLSVPAGWLSREVLQSIPPALQAVPCEISTHLLRAAVTFFPGATNKLIFMLRGRITCKEVAQMLTKDDASGVSNEYEVECALQTLTERFQHLNPSLQKYVLHQGVSATIHNLPLFGRPTTSTPLADATAGSTGGPSAPLLSPKELYVQALDADLLGPLRRDANITESVLSQIKAVFLALPPYIQARILLAAIEHPHATGEATSEQKAEVVRDLLSAGGIVAVKLAQMIAEDPRVPPHYRKLLGSLRDNNEAMSQTEMWHRLPGTVRERIAFLGSCLGTGSVKQVNMALLENDSKRLPEGSKLVAVAILRRGVEEEALASLSALEASTQMQPVINKLGRMVYGEFDLFKEGEALEEFSRTSIGSNPRFRVVGVEHHSPKCLIEEIAKGKTVASALEGIGKEWKKKSEEAGADPIIALTMDTLVEFHRVVLGAFTNDGLIHSDIHLGNVVQDVASDGNSVDFVLFDVGQFERVSKEQTRAILWALSWISTPERRQTLRSVALAQLLLVSSLTHESSHPDVGNRSRLRADLSRRIEKAFDEATAPFEDGTVPDKKTAWILFLRNSEREGVSLPKGAFAIAKMMDGIVSQADSYGLPAVLDETVEQFLVSSSSWMEMTSIVGRTVLRQLGAEK